MLTPAPFFYFPLQAFSQNAQPSLEEGMIFFLGGGNPNKRKYGWAHPDTACYYYTKFGIIEVMPGRSRVSPRTVGLSFTVVFRILPIRASSTAEL